MRYFAELTYKGTPYCGWQRQPNGVSVQEVIENVFSTVLRTPIEVTGCGRTDAGVHARQYFLHFDFEETIPESFLNRINKVLPDEIAIKKIFEVHSEAHARYDAYQRSYEYHISFQKNPFNCNTLYHYPFVERPDFLLIQEAAALILNYQAFLPFCKSKSDAKTMNCDIRKSEWIVNEQEDTWVFQITANRFLRGMVRLIVGMCLNAGWRKIEIEEVKLALDQQTRLKKDLSVSPQGLFLTEVKYPFIEEE